MNLLVIDKSMKFREKTNSIPDIWNIIVNTFEINIFDVNIFKKIA